MKTLVVLPSYNEKNDITDLIEKISNQSENNYIVVIDDNSPDQTIPHIEKFLIDKNYKDKVHLIKRPNKSGR